MELHSIRGGNIQDLKDKKYTIGVGISLGNKWFTPENIVEVIKWALEHTKGRVVVYIADSIRGINLSVRNRISLEKATRRTVDAGIKLFEHVKLNLRDLPDEELQRIVYVRWEELADQKFKDKVAYLMSLYQIEGEFRETIHALVRDYVSKEQRSFSEEDIHTFGRYIVEEMPEFLGRVPMKGIAVDAYTYPYDNEITKFADRIQRGEMFLDIKERILDTEPKVFLEVR